MGRRINTTQPMVLNVMLAPFVESFQIVPSDTTQQWYYANNDGFLPDREENPLILTPTLTVFDPDSKQTYTPSFGDVRWYYLDSGSWVLITNTTESTDSITYPYVVYADGHIKVNKNVSYDSPVTLLCECPYIDPRSAGTSYTVKDTVDLTTNRDATVVMPNICINQGTSQFYNIFKDTQNSQYTFTAKVLLNNQDITSSSSIKWYVLNISTGAETLIDDYTTVDGVRVPTYPCYISGQSTATLTLDAMYAEDITVVARVLSQTTDPDSPYYHTVYPCKAISSLRWKYIPMDVIVRSNNSGGVRSDTEYIDFDIVANIEDSVLTDAQKADNLRINWKRRPKSIPTGQSSAPIIDEGWGQRLRLYQDKLKAYSTTLVFVEAYLLGAYETVTDSGEAVTDGNEVVYDR